MGPERRRAVILVDRIGHLVSDQSLDELHRFAGALGLRRAWLQDHRIPHYDLTTSNMRWRAVAHGATLVDSRALVRRALRKGISS